MSAARIPTSKRADARNSKCWSACRATAAAVLCALLSGCSDDSSDPSMGGGGRMSNGGASSTGGSPGPGGSIGSGGSPASGGAASGGATGSSGSSAQGGTAGAGGLTSGGTSGTAGKGGAASGGGGGVTAGAGSGAGGASAGAAGKANGGGGNGGGGGTQNSGGAAGSAGYNPCPTAAGVECSILPLGDSITEGCCAQPYGGYRIELFRQAVKNNKSITFVGQLTNGPDMVEGRAFPKRHQGHGGYTINQIADASITDRSLSMYQPKIVLLMIGTNDINGNQDVANAPKRLGSLVDKITNGVPSALVVVAAIIPTRTDGTNQAVMSYNSAIKNEVNMRAMSGKHVVFLDNYAAISQNPNYKNALLADNLHPNDAGYAVLGQSFYSLISSVLPAAQ